MKKKSKQNKFSQSQKSFSRQIFVFILTVLLLFTTYSGARLQNTEPMNTEQINEKAIVWDVFLYFNNPTGQSDYVVFGEAPDANDGPPADSYDVAKPPPPMPPYIRAFFKDNLPSPYTNLWRDYRQYPDTEKTWNLSIQWYPEDYETPSSITITWNAADVGNSEYTTVDFCTNAGTVLKNMLIDTSYTFTCPALVPQYFKIICGSSGGNLPPVANPDSYSTNEDTTLSITAPGVLGNDNDPNGDPLTAVKQSDPSHGSVTVNSNGGFTYIPTANYHGSDSFSYKAYDGLLYSNTATVTISINPINDAPVAYPDSYSTDEGVPLTINAPGVLSNDIDVDGDPLTAVKVTDPSHGSVTLNSNGGFTYSPGEGFHGIDTFTYKAYDGMAYSNLETVTITVNAVNHPPEATDDFVTVAMDSTNNKINVLTNDNDPDGDSLIIIDVSAASHGTTTTDGSFVYYSPTTGYSGADSFTYTISDGHGGTDTASVSVTVQANAPPNKPSRPQGTSEGKLNTPYTYSTSTTDPNGHQVYYLWDWGDGTQSDWMGPYTSGASAETTHTWTVKTSSVKVKAKDINGAESDWSESLPISMPLSLQYLFGPFSTFIQLFIRFIRGEFAGMRFIQVLRMRF